VNKQILLYYSIVLIAGIFLQSCKNSKVKPPEFARYINDPANGLSKERKVNGITIKVKYLPTSLLAYKEFKESEMVDEAQYDSLYTTYASGRSFLMEIIPDNKEDLMSKDIDTESEYKERVNQMNFNLRDYLELSVNGETIPASIANFENIYGLQNGRKVMVVFPIKPSDKKGNGDIQFTYHDEIYATGINHFTFSAKDLQAVPEIKL
jgi:hypothetical protein